MSSSSITRKVDAILKPLGFQKRGAIWNRLSDSVIDVIDIQTSKSGDTYTLNVGVLDREVHEVFWGEAVAETVEPPMCTVSARVGDLMYGTDKWWKTDTSESEQDSITKAVAAAISFLDRTHTRPQMTRLLTDTDVTQKRYPPPIINLALLSALEGKVAEANAMLDELQDKLSGPWLERIKQVRERLSLPLPGKAR